MICLKNLKDSVQRNLKSLAPGNDLEYGAYTSVSYYADVEKSADKVGWYWYMDWQIDTMESYGPGSLPYDRKLAQARFVCHISYLIE